jgi:hypothetical protein
MSANLGAECPPDVNCPTQEFKDKNHNYTLVALVEAYGENITDTADSLVNIANTTVGTAMTQVRIFLCNMNISFVADGYNQVRDEVCETMLGGFSQINWALWSLGFCLELIALLANLLATRLRGYSRKVANPRMDEDDFKGDRYSYYANADEV